MIYGIFHRGSGLGNQLHRYVATRIKALELGVDFSMIAPELFKGKDFMNLDMGKSVPSGWTNIIDPAGRVIVDTHFEGINEWEEWDKFTYDPDWNFIEDNTIIDGSFEDERYFENHLPEIIKWLDVEYLDKDWENICVIGFRGGEYYTVPELGLPKEYYDRAIEEMKKINPDMKFEVHTDDKELAQKFFPDYPIIQQVGVNWRAMRYAKHAIIANSSFYVLPRLLNDGITIAPRYFNRYNTKKWDYPQFYYKSFKYI